MKYSEIFWRSWRKNDRCNSRRSDAFNLSEYLKARSHSSSVPLLKSQIPNPFFFPRSFLNPKPRETREREREIAEAVVSSDYLSLSAPLQSHRCRFTTSSPSPPALLHLHAPAICQELLNEVHTPCIPRLTFLLQRTTRFPLIASINFVDCTTVLRKNPLAIVRTYFCSRVVYLFHLFPGNDLLILIWVL
jgi:hypothetical protein